MCAVETPVVETASGRVAGCTSDGVHVFKGIPYGASTAGANRFMPPRKPEPWTGVRETHRLCRPLAAGARRGATAGAGDGLGSGRHPAGRRGLPDAACLDARPRQRQAPGHGLAAWRRLLLRLGQLAALRQHQPRTAQRRRGRRGQSPAQHLRPSRPVGARRALRAVGQCRRARSGRWRSNGCASMPPASAAIPATSRSSASRAAAERSAPCSPCRSAKGLFHKADRAERRQRPLRRARAHHAARRCRAEASRRQRRPARRCRPCRSNVCRKPSRRRRRPCPGPRFPCSTATISAR